MATLADKIRAARRVSVKVGNATFHGSRATVEDMIRARSMTDAEFCRNHIDGWEGVREKDVIEGGSKEEIAFDKELFDLVIGEKVEWFSVISPAIYKDAVDRQEKRKETVKK